MDAVANSGMAVVIVVSVAIMGYYFFIKRGIQFISFNKKFDAKFLRQRSRVALMAGICREILAVDVVRQIRAFNAGRDRGCLGELSDRLFDLKPRREHHERRRNGNDCTYT